MKQRPVVLARRSIRLARVAVIAVRALTQATKWSRFAKETNGVDVSEKRLALDRHRPGGLESLQSVANTSNSFHQFNCPVGGHAGRCAIPIEYA